MDGIGGQQGRVSQMEWSHIKIPVLFSPLCNKTPGGTCMPIDERIIAIKITESERVQFFGLLCCESHGSGNKEKNHFYGIYSLRPEMS
jgi:hypothetical protein